MALEGSFDEGVAAFRESREGGNEPGLVDCQPAVMTEFLAWVFAQEAKEQRKRDARARGHLMVQVALDRAAVHVSELDCSEWCRWICYLLECLDAMGMERGLAGQDIDAMLSLVHRSVSERVCLGRW